MKNAVLLALLTKLVEDRLKELPSAVIGPRGFRGPPGADGADGKDFVFSEHEETIRSWAKEFALKFEDLTAEEISALRGPKGLDGKDGADGKDFIFDDHKEYFDSLRPKFSDFTADEIAAIRGPKGLDGKDGKDGADGKDFVFDDHREFFESLRLKFEDLTAEEISALRGPKGNDGRDGKDGSDFSFEDSKEKISEIIAETVSGMSSDLKLKFSDLTAEEISALRGPRGQKGRRGKDFNFEEHREYFDSLRLRFSDLTQDEKDSLKLYFKDLTAEEKAELSLSFSDLTADEISQLRGPRGQRGQRGVRGDDGERGSAGPQGPRGNPGPVGARGIQGPQGPAGIDGKDGKDAPYIVRVETRQIKINEFSLIFIFSDGSEKESDPFEIPHDTQIYIAGGALGDGGSGGGGTGPQGPPGESAYEIAVDQGFIGTEAEWLESLVGADGLSAYEVAVENGFVGTEAEWLESLIGPPGAGLTFFDEGIELDGPASEVNFVGDGVIATSDGTRVTVTIPGGGDSAFYQLFTCEPDVYVGAAVRLKKVSEVVAMMSDWPTLMSLVMLSDITTYEKVASNALADSLLNSNVIGIVESKPTATTCYVRIWGPTSALYLGLDVEDEYYLSDTIPGLVVPSAAMPTVSGRVLVKLGQALNENRLIYVRGERTEIP